MSKTTIKHITTKTVNAKLYALKHTLYKRLEKSLDNDKNLIKEGAKLTFKDYCKIQLVPCTKTTLDKNKVKELCDKVGIDISTLEKHTDYYRIDIDNIPEETNIRVENIINNLETDNDRIIARAASAIKEKV